MLIGHRWFKDCFVCKGRGHHLSRSQFAKVKRDSRDKLFAILKSKKINRSPTENEVLDRTWKTINKSKMLCNLCHGSKIIVYPHN